MTSLHVICGLGPPPIKNPGYAYVSTMQKSFSDGNGIFNRTMHHAILQKNANIFLKIEINFARLAWQLPIPKPHRKLVCYHKKVSLDMWLFLDIIGFK